MGFCYLRKPSELSWTLGEDLRWPLFVDSWLLDSVGSVLVSDSYCRSILRTLNTVEMRIPLVDHGATGHFQASIYLSKITTGGQLAIFVKKKNANKFRNCGFLRYWTLSNLPLFLLGTPIFALLTISAFSMLTQHHTTTSDTRTSEKFRKNPGHGSSQILRNMAISQLGLVLLTLTTAHVQIITRLASAYPVWLWYTASSAQKGDAPLLKGVVAFSVIYATIQAALFASFLPPA